MAHEVICDTAILYRVYNGKLESFKGSVVKLTASYGSQYRFNRPGGYGLFCSVSDKSCVVKYGNVWMRRRNDKKARELLKRNYIDEIAEHEKKICAIKGYIEALEKEES